jgi:hypothetical protein
MMEMGIPFRWFPGLTIVFAMAAFLTAPSGAMAQEVDAFGNIGLSFEAVGEKETAEPPLFDLKAHQVAQAQKKDRAGGQDKGAEGKTGTDPRDFGSKFMPYYLHTQLRNNLQVDQLNMFGMIAIDPKSTAMTFDLPVAKRLNYSNISAFKSGVGSLPPETPTGGGGLPFAGLETDGDTNGYGDLGLRFFFKPASLTTKKASHMFGAEVTLPTASEDVLGGDTWVLSPMYVFVHNVKLLSPGFVAFMNFYDFDVAKESERPDVIGRDLFVARIAARYRF